MFMFDFQVEHLSSFMVECQLLFGGWSVEMKAIGNSTDVNSHVMLWHPALG